MQARVCVCVCGCDPPVSVSACMRVHMAMYAEACMDVSTTVSRLAAEILAKARPSELGRGLSLPPALGWALGEVAAGVTRPSQLLLPRLVPSLKGSCLGLGMERPGPRVPPPT